MPADKKDYSYTGIPGANNIIEEEVMQPSTFETVDYAFYDFLNDDLNLRALTNKGWKKVPIVWASSERAFFSKQKKELSDLDGTLIFPIMSVERTAVSKDLNKKGSFWGNPYSHFNKLYGGRIVIGRKIVNDKTRNFAVADNKRVFDSESGAASKTPGRQAHYKTPNKKIVYQTQSIPMPVYVGMTYQVTIRTEYIQQMNELLQPFASLGGHINSFTIERDGHRYETFLQASLAHNNNASSWDAEERIYQSVLTFETLGYLIGEGENSSRPSIIKTENAVEVKFPREHVIVGDLQQYLKNGGFYRE